jgi:hypothetical protein
MFGEEIGGGQGKRTGRRIVSTEPLRVEASFEDYTKLLGLDGMNIGTYIATTKSDGSLFGMGEGVYSSLTGDMATWKAIGTGAFGPDGSVHYRGSLSFFTTAPKLASLNAMATVFDFTIDAQGNTQSHFWDWK